MVIKKKFYVTTPIYYTNGPPHLGGAYTTTLADILARWNRLQKKEVFFLTGTDEHGQKIQEIADQSGKKPKEFVDQIVGDWKNAFKLLNISNDYFIRTTNPKHEKEVQHMLQTLFDKGLIYKSNYESYYCVGCEQYLTKKDLVDGKCLLHDRKPELKKEEAYLFKLSKFQNKLAKLIKSGEYNITPEKRRKEILTFIESGLEDVSISRLKEKISWGIELPFDKNHYTWVWPDAFWNYVSGLKINKKFDKFWPANVQLMAKDILRVHSTIWPALLLGLDLPLPKNLVIHGYFTVNGKKMSKSLGNVIDPINLVENYGADSVRYFLARNIPFGEDGNVSVKALVERHNNELADKLGNLVSRVTALSEKNGMQKTPNKLLKKLKLKQIEKYFETYEIDKALNEIFSFVDVCNEYVQSKKPWETKDKKVLYELIDSIKVIAILLWPVIPETSEAIAENLKFDIKYSEISKPYKVSKIKKNKILFQKIEFKEGEKKKEGQKEIKKIKIEGVKDMNTIQYEDFAKLELKVGTIKKVEDIEGADKLYKLTVDTGEKDNRVLCAGIKEHYSKDELKGKQIVVIVNLEPRKMRGIESQGMLLAAVSDDHKKVVLVSPDKKVDSGLKVS